MQLICIFFYGIKYTLKKHEIVSYLKSVRFSSLDADG